MNRRGVPSAGRGARVGLAIASSVGLLWVIVVRVTGPSDLWHQTQPKTVSYTTAILVHGGTQWILPVERGQLPATKPPLYNWLAAPAVALLGYGSEVGHKMPSIAALIACWALIVLIGRSLPPRDGTVGWMAALMFVANYSVFKLGYLARPDMLLTFWIVLAWALATMLLLDPPARPRARRGMAAGFWIAVALAALTKGPPAAVPLVYAALAAGLLAGGLTDLRRLQWWWGVPLVVVIAGGWLSLAWRIDAEHVRQVLLQDEVLDRVLGTDARGRTGWWRGLYETPAYFVVRFAPWSIVAIAGCAGTWWRDPDTGLRVWRAIGAPAGAWLRGAALMTVIVIAIFMIGANRRADYIVSAFAPGALLGAWWLSSLPIRRTVRWGVPAVAGVVLAALTVYNAADPGAPSRGFSDGISRFIHDAGVAMDHRPADLVCCWTGESHLQAMLGASQRSGLDAVLARLEREGPFWIAAGLEDSPPHELAERLVAIRPDVEIRPVVVSSRLPRAMGWPEQVTLYRVERREDLSSRVTPGSDNPEER